MITKLRTFALTMLLACTAVTAAKAETLYETLNVDLVLTYQGTATTDSRTGEIKDVAGKRSISTAQFMQLMAGNLHVTLSNGASIVRVTSLYPGTNYMAVSTNSTTPLAGYTLITNVWVPTSIVWMNPDTNGGPLFVTNSGPETPINSNGDAYVAYSATNFVNYLIQGIPEKVILGSQPQYYIHNGSGVNDTNFSDTNVWIPLVGVGTNNLGVAISTLDEAENFQNNYINGPNSPYNGFPLDDQNYLSISGDNVTTNYYYGDTYYAPSGVEFLMAQLVTNLNANSHVGSVGPIFVGTIKTNMALTGTLYGDTISISMGVPFQTVGTSNFLANLYLSGTADATATTGNVGSGKSAMPFSSWNSTFAVTGSGWLGGTDTNTASATTNFVYSSSETGMNVDENLSFYAPGIGYVTSTNLPGKFTNDYEYVSGPKQSMDETPGFYISGVGSTPFANPPPTFTNFAYAQTNYVTNDFTLSGYGYVTNIYTNISTNVLTYVSTETNYSTNFNVNSPSNSTFSITGTVKQQTVKISGP